MNYIIIGLSFSDLLLIHSFYHPHTMLTSTYFNKHTELYDVTLTNNAIIKVNAGDITLDLGAKLLTIPHGNYNKLIIE